MKYQGGGIAALVGAQYGSEGKGKIAAILANRFDVHVRTGGPNAGHTITHHCHDTCDTTNPLHSDTHTSVLRSVPCGWTNKKATLFIGAGSVIDVDVLNNELDEIAQYDRSIYERVFVDSAAHVITQQLRDDEGGTAGDMHRLIGSTGKGIGAARVARMWRSTRGHALTVGDVANSIRCQVINDTSRQIDALRAHGADVLLEGTQGVGLSLYHGPWPYVTSADISAAAMLSEAGLSPAHLMSTILVTRTFPIRVAGNSGPMYNELTWEEVSRQHAGRMVTEQTTVTKKTRRVGEFDFDQVANAVRMHAPRAVIALTFADYLYGGGALGVRDIKYMPVGVLEFAREVEERCGAPVILISTGPNTEDHVWLDHDHSNCG